MGMIFGASTIISVIFDIIIVAAIVLVVVALASGKKDSIDKAVLNYKGPEGENIPDSYFDGNTFQLIGWRLLTAFLTTITFGIAFPWAMCMMRRWEAKHTVINGRRLKFNGKGIQLIGKYILWSFLTVITLGIYSIWFGIAMEKWVVKHTVYADDDSKAESKFTGRAGGWFFNHFLFVLLIVVTFGIATPWAQTRLMRWKAKHTVIGGSRLIFTGKGINLLGKYIGYGLLTVITFGIFGLFVPVKLLKWEVSNRKALYRTGYIRKFSKAHEEAALKDYAKFRLAANDTELAVLKSGITGNETLEQLEPLAESGNSYAQYKVASSLKDENGSYTEKALALLKSSAEAKYHPAMFDYALTVQNENTTLYEELLEGAARNGNTEAPWLLKGYYEKFAYQSHDNDAAKSLELIKKSAYWFKVSIEQEHPSAIAEKAGYDKYIDVISLWQCEVGLKSSNEKNDNAVEGEKEEKKPASKGQIIAILSIVGAVVVALIIGIVDIANFVSATDHPYDSYTNKKLRTITDHKYSDDYVVFVDHNAVITEDDTVVYITFNEYNDLRVTKGVVEEIVVNDDGTLSFNIYSLFHSDDYNNSTKASSGGIFGIFRGGFASMEKRPAMSEDSFDSDDNDTDGEDENYELVSEKYVIGKFVKKAGWLKTFLATGPFRKDYDEIPESYKAWVDYKVPEKINETEHTYTVDVNEALERGEQDGCTDNITAEDVTDYTFVYEEKDINVKFSFETELSSDGELIYNGSFNIVHPEQFYMSFKLDETSTDPVYIATDRITKNNSFTRGSDLTLLTGAIMPGKALDTIPVDKMLGEYISQYDYSEHYSSRKDMRFYIVVIRTDEDGTQYYCVSDAINLRISVYKVTDQQELNAIEGTKIYREGNEIYCERYFFYENTAAIRKFVFKNVNLGAYYDPDSYRHLYDNGWFWDYDESYYYEGTPVFVTDGDFVKSVSVDFKDVKYTSDTTEIAFSETYTFNEIGRDHLVITDSKGNTETLYHYFAFDPERELLEIAEVFNIDLSC